MNKLLSVLVPWITLRTILLLDRKLIPSSANVNYSFTNKILRIQDRPNKSYTLLWVIWGGCGGVGVVVVVVLGLFFFVWCFVVVIFK